MGIQVCRKNRSASGVRVRAADVPNLLLRGGRGGFVGSPGVLLSCLGIRVVAVLQESHALGNRPGLGIHVHASTSVSRRSGMTNSRPKVWEGDSPKKFLYSTANRPNSDIPAPLRIFVTLTQA
jgi:hypothetical protein